MSLLDHIKRAKPAEPTPTASTLTPTSAAPEPMASTPTPQVTVTPEPMAQPTVNTQIIHQSDAHYFVGIDLGTTHCVLSYGKADD